MTTAPSPATNKADKAEKPQRSLSVFEWMQKKSVPIFIACLVSMFGFGAWASIHDFLFGRGNRNPDAPPEVIGSFEWNGKKFPISYADFQHAMPRNGRSDIQASAPSALSKIVREKLVDELDMHVSDGERKDALQTQIVDPVKQANDGKFSQTDFVRIANSFGMTPEQFQARLQSDMRLAKLQRELERVADNTNTSDIYDQFKKQFPKVKLAGFFAATEQFTAQAKLAADDKGELTPEGRAKLETWWKTLAAEKQAAFHKGGAVMTADGLGFRFAGKSDADLDKEFNAVSAISKTSLADLTKGFTPTADDLTKLKLRFTRLKEVYGVAADQDVEKEFENRKNRMTQEWKILQLEKQIYATIAAEIAAGRDVDFKALAEKNNLLPINVSGMTFEALTKLPEFPGTWVGQFVGLKDGELLNWNAVIDGPQAIAFARGPVDEFGKHASIWRMKKKDDKPAVALIDVIKEAREAYEKEEAVRLRDAVLKAFEDKMDVLLNEKTKTFAETARADAKKAIDDDTKGLDPAKDKERIDQITKSRNEEADTRINAEKAKYRSEAFDLAWNDKAITGIRDTQGWFKAQSVSSEALPDKETATVEEKVAAALRRDFQMQLLDQPQQDKYIEVGTVSPMTDSTSFPGLRGIAKLVEKKVPTVADMYANPQEMAQAESSLFQKSMMARIKSEWDLPTMKRVFKFESEWLDKEIAKDIEQKRKDEEWKINGPKPKAVTPKPAPTPTPQK